MSERVVRRAGAAPGRWLVAVAVVVVGCGGGEPSEPSAEPAVDASAVTDPESDPSADAAKLAGKWRSEFGQFTEYVLEDGTLFTVFGDQKIPCRLDAGRISYRVSGLEQEMSYRFIDDDTVEYTSPSLKNWSLVQKRQQ